MLKKERKFGKTQNVSAASDSSATSIVAIRTIHFGLARCHFAAAAPAITNIGGYSGNTCRKPMFKLDRIDMIRNRMNGIARQHADHDVENV